MTNEQQWSASIPGRQLASCHFCHVYFLIKAFRILNKNTSVQICWEKIDMSVPKTHFW